MNGIKTPSPNNLTTTTTLTHSNCLNPIGSSFRSKVIQQPQQQQQPQKMNVNTFPQSYQKFQMPATMINGFSLNSPEYFE